MELTIDSATERPLLKRKHVIGTLTFTGEKTPSNKDTAAAIAKKVGASEDAVAIRSIYTGFGTTQARVEAYVYESKELLEKTEARPKKKAVAGAAPAAGA